MLHATLPSLAGAAFLAFAVALVVRGAPSRAPSWRVPAALAALFLAYSLHAVAAEGPFGFWGEHTRGAWGNQIWFDLLLAIGIGWYLVLPRLRALGMRPLPWLALVACTGSIGLLALLARAHRLDGCRNDERNVPATRAP